MDPVVAALLIAFLWIASFAGLVHLMRDAQARIKRQFHRPESEYAWHPDAGDIVLLAVTGLFGPVGFLTALGVQTLWFWGDGPSPLKPKTNP